jgi:hypothetical protein
LLREPLCPRVFVANKGVLLPRGHACVQKHSGVQARSNTMNLNYN